MTPRTLLVSLVLVTVAVQRAPAQTRLPVATGSRVRLRFNPASLGPRLLGHAGRYRVAATFVRSTLDTVVVLPERGGAEVTLAVAGLDRLEVSGGVHSRTGRGALIGLLTGAAGGAVAGAIACADCALNDSFFAIDQGGAAALGGALGGLGGLALGALIGAFVRTERWENVPLGRPRLTFMPAPGGMRVAVSLALRPARR